MVRRFFILLWAIGFFVHQNARTQEVSYEDFLDFGTAQGITIFPEYPPFSIEADILYFLNSSSSDRKQFIEDTLLDGSGFLRTANARYRKTDFSEKASSIWHGIARVFSFGIVPLKPLLEAEYDRLPKGEFYSFESVILFNELNNISADVLSVLELEYMLQIEFRNGIILDDNKNYYSQDNIEKFELIIYKLPDSPESIRKIKERFSNEELPKIKNALDRYNNPSENYLRAVSNLNFDIFKKR